MLSSRNWGISPRWSVERVAYAGCMSTIDVATPNLVIEPAGHDDIVAAAQVYQAAAEALSDQLRARNPWTNAAARTEDLQLAIRILANLRAAAGQSVVVARERGDVVGVGALQLQPPHAHVAFLFVHPDSQNRGIGRQLLARLRQVIDESGSTVVTLASSRDPRAWQRYMRFGLHPGPPQLPFRAQAPRFPAMPQNEGYVARPIGAADLDPVVALDRDARGVDRTRQIATWLAAGDAGVLVERAATGEPVGYALATMGPHHGQVGPVVANAPGTFPLVLDHALALAGTVPNPYERPWRVAFSARNHLAIAPLLAAGFSAENLVAWFESGPVGHWDRYIFRDEDEL